MPVLWLPPAVWFHGIQSTTIGGASLKNRKPCKIICWLLQIMRCVLITAFGRPVEPDEKRNFATSSGLIAAYAASTASVGVTPQRSSNEVELRPTTPSSANTISMSESTAASSARRYFWLLETNTIPGLKI